MSESLTDIALDLVLLGRAKEGIEPGKRGLREEGGAGPKNLAESVIWTRSGHDGGWSRVNRSGGASRPR